MTEKPGQAKGSGDFGAARPKRSPLNRRTFTQGAVGVAGVGLAASLTGWSAARHADVGEREAPQLSRTVAAKRIVGELPRDPTSEVWRALPAVTLPLQQQYMVEPRLPLEGMVISLNLRSMHNGSEIGFHMSWTDPTSDDVESPARFRDSVAVQLPVDPTGPVGLVMGQPNRPVHILHWRASWQRAIATGTARTRDAFPNSVTDVAPEDIMSTEEARGYYPALGVGNAMAKRDRASPVEELVAEGFGTITSHAQQRAQGAGVFGTGRWEVVVVVPMQGGDNQATLKAGDVSRVAVAVWNGGNGNRGARKQFADWSALELEA